MAEPALCPGCQEPLSLDAPWGLCPLCLLRQVIEDESGVLSASGEPGSSFADASTVAGDESSMGPPGEGNEARQAGFPEFVGRYRLDRVIGRGGMGEVIKGRDVEIGREIALKVLRAKYRDSPEMSLRFVEEAQIGGQLVHPAIVPVYEMGTFPDGRPFFVMKLVKGRTLADLLKSRSDPAEDLPRYLSIFDQVCRAMAYAHSRGVIHRDLKSTNLMVGAFGEVQTMDWGMAKLLAREAGPEAESVIYTIRDVNDGTVDGNVKGTLHSMPPEQARGEVDRLDERADVFALGAILCEILTGYPPYLGQSDEEIHAKAARADLADALARLQACGADAELQHLARACLSPARDDRPREAGRVAAAMADYFEGVQDRLRQAELDRVEAETRAEGESKRRVLADELALEAERRAASERKRRRATMALAASVIALTAVGVLSFTFQLQRSQARATTFATLCGEATTLRDRALAQPEDIAQWRAALASVRQAQGAVGMDDPAAHRQLLALRGQVQDGLDAVERDRTLMNRLIDIRSSEADDLGGSVTDAAYAEAFSDGGLDMATLAPDRAGQMIKARPSVVALALVTAIDDWSAVRRDNLRDQPGAKRLAEVAASADTDPWRNDLRFALGRIDPAMLQALAQSANFEELGAISLVLLGTALSNAGDLGSAEAVLRQAQRRHPDDVWVNYYLAQVLEKRNRRAEAIRYYVAARSIRPEVAHELAHALEYERETDEAIAVFQDLSRRRPGNGRHLGCLGLALRKAGRFQESTAALDAAAAVLREAIRSKPDLRLSYFSLAQVLRSQKKLDEAVDALREVIRLRPDWVAPHTELGKILELQGKPAMAEASFREAIRLNSKETNARFFLGVFLNAQGKPGSAETEFRELIRLKPDDPAIHTNLGWSLLLQRKSELAEAEYREAIRLEPRYAAAHGELGRALKDQGKLDQAIEEFREAIRLRPDDDAARTNLEQSLVLQGKANKTESEFRESFEKGHSLILQGRPGQAEVLLRELVRLKPEDSGARFFLGVALNAQGQPDRAEAEFRVLIRLKPDDPAGHSNLGWSLLLQRKPELAEAEYREAIRLEPRYATAHHELGRALQEQGKLTLAEAEYREAIRLSPKDINPRFSLGVLLNAQGQPGSAEAEFREMIRLKPDDAGAHANLGWSLLLQRKPELAEAEYRELIRIEPGNAAAHNELGEVLASLERPEPAEAEFQEAIRLKPDYSKAHFNLGDVRRSRKELEAAEMAYREAIRFEPGYAEAHCNLGFILERQGRFAESLVEYRRGHELGSGRPEWQHPSAEWVREAEQKGGSTSPPEQKKIGGVIDPPNWGRGAKVTTGACTSGI